MAGRLDGKVAMITGGCSGIGLGTVELFVAEGAQVVAADLQDEKGAMLEKRFPGKVRYAHCDVTVEADIVAALALAKSAFGGLDILFNNAGAAGLGGSVEAITAEGWDKTFALLVRGPALGMHHALPLMRERGGGSIVTLTYLGGERAVPRYNVMGVAKAALDASLRYLAADLGSADITVNAVSAGPVRTLAARSIPGFTSMEEIVAERAPLRRNIEAADVAEAAVYLLGARNVTGTIAYVDAGYHAMGM